jgi:hypothetical protein
MEKQCSLCSKCTLFKGLLNIPEEIRIRYNSHYCLDESYRWKKCKRYIFENNNGSCPDFVMPNTLLTLDQIWQKSQWEYTMNN